MPGAFQPIAFIDTLYLASSLLSRLNRFETVDEGVREYRVRWPDDNSATGWKQLAPKVWPELTTTLRRIGEIGEQLLGPLQRGRIFLEMLDPAATRRWQPEITDDWIRVHLALRTNPRAFLYAGAEVASPAPGWITQARPDCSLNLGEDSRIHLIMDVRRREKAK